MKYKTPFLVAEISANHNGKLKNALNLIKEAKLYGADAVKLQTYKPSTMTVNSKNKQFVIKKGLWKNYNLWQLYEKAQTPYKWHKRLFQYAKKLKIKIFSTPFDEEAVDFLEKLNCPIYKVASFEMNDLSLIKRIAKTKKPIIISTGMASINEIEKAFKTAKKYGSTDITLLYCVSNYPSNIEDFNLNNIKILKKKFNCRIGLSDHSNNNIVAISSVVLGAEIIEKHIALKNQKKGLDLDFSIKGEQITEFKKDLVNAYKLKGKDFFYRSKKENQSKLLRRSVFAVKNIQKGEKFTTENIKKLRPALGLDLSYYDKLLNKKSPQSISKNSSLTNNILKKLKIRK